MGAFLQAQLFRWLTVFLFPFFNTLFTTRLNNSKSWSFCVPKAANLLVELVRSLLRMLEMHVALLGRSSSGSQGRGASPSPLLSPYLGGALLWSLTQWASAYLLPDLTLYKVWDCSLWCVFVSGICPLRLLLKSAKGQVLYRTWFAMPSMFFFCCWCCFKSCFGSYYVWEAW